MNRSLRIFDFLPLLIFSYGARIFGITSTQDSWGPAFYIGGGLAVLQMIFYLYRGYSIDYIALGANLFLIYGACGYALYRPLLIPYGIFKQASVFFWIGLVGSVTTLVARQGFIQVFGVPRKVALISSMALLGAVAIAFLTSYLLVSYTNFMGIGVVVPFVLLLFVRELLRNYFAK